MSDNVNNTRDQQRQMIRPLDGSISQKRAREIDKFINEDRSVFFSTEEGYRPSHLDMTGRFAGDPEPPELEGDGMSLADREKIYAAHCKDVFERAFAEPQMSLQDLLPWRIKVAYRLVREMARIKNFVATNDLLIEGLSPVSNNTDPWKVPEHVGENPAMGERLYSHDAVRLFDLAEHISMEGQVSKYVFSSDGDVLQYFPGLPILPPPVPRAMCNEDGTPKEDYNPEDDEALCLYVEVIKALARDLYIEQGCLREKFAGRYGLQGMFDVRTIRLVFPGKLQILAWEEILINQTLEWIVEKGIVETNKLLTGAFGFMSHETLPLIKAAKVLARNQTESEIEDDRGVMLLRLDDYIRRARESLDLRAENAGLKNLAIVLGLTRIELDDTMKDFRGMAQAWTEKQSLEKELVEVESPKQLSAN